MVRIVRDESRAWLLVENGAARATPRATSSFAGLALGWRKTVTGRPVRSTMAMVAVSTLSAAAAAETIAVASACESELNVSAAPFPIVPSVQTCGVVSGSEQPGVSGTTASSVCARHAPAIAKMMIDVTVGRIRYLPRQLDLINKGGGVVRQNERVAPFG